MIWCYQDTLKDTYSVQIYIQKFILRLVVYGFIEKHLKFIAAS